MSTPRYPTVRVRVEAAEAEEVGLELFALGASGVEERDQTTMSKSDGSIELIGHFPDEATAARASEALGEAAQVDFIVGDAWKDEWKKFFRPARIGAHFVVRPPWEPFEAGPEDRVITIDPGAAFGTGTHETTRLVLAEIERVATGGSVLDVGCGSGILAIAAKMVGAASAMGIDIDPVAARIAEENAEANGVSLRASTTPVDAVEGRFDLVLANIRRPILVPMADALVARTAGTLVLSGLLVPERDEVRACFDKRFDFIREAVDGDWLALTYRARG